MTTETCRVSADRCAQTTHGADFALDARVLFAGLLLSEVCRISSSPARARLTVWVLVRRSEAGAKLAMQRGDSAAVLVPEHRIDAGVVADSTELANRLEDDDEPVRVSWLAAM